MEIREGFRRVPSRPIALAMAVLAVVALALTVWFVLGSNSQVRSTGNDRTLLTNTVQQRCGDAFSPHDPVCRPAADPYSPHDAL